MVTEKTQNDTSSSGTSSKSSYASSSGSGSPSAKTGDTTSLAPLAFLVALLGTGTLLIASKRRKGYYRAYKKEK
jgi:LPXTG-motif cell wall-anchored protein